MRYGIALLAVAAVSACAHQPVVTTATTTTTTTETASGEVAPTGMWVVENTYWMTPEGVLYAGGPTGVIVGLQPADFAALTNANIMAHVTTGDSLEIAVSRDAETKLTNPSVVDFARRMVREHTAHLHKVEQAATNSSITLLAAPSDTADALMAARIAEHLSSASNGKAYDRQFMRYEIAMHEHMLHDLRMAQSQASGPTLDLVRGTIPVVQEHLSDARDLLNRLGGM